MARITPEGRVKDRVKAALKKFPRLYQHWPVQNGMGKPCLDAHCCFHGIYFAIETKAPGNKTTKRQDDTIAEISQAGGRTFVIDSDEDIAYMVDWLTRVHEAVTEGTYA